MYRNLNAEMARRGMTLESLAKQLGITTGTLCQKMNGKYDFSLKQAVEIKKILQDNEPLDYLFESNVTV